MRKVHSLFPRLWFNKNRNFHPGNGDAVQSADGHRTGGHFVLMMAVGFVLGRAGKITEGGPQPDVVPAALHRLSLCDGGLLSGEADPRLDAGGCGRLCGGAGLLSALFAVSLLFFRRQPADARDTLRFAAVYGNIGFMGLPWSSPSSGRRRWSTARWPCWPST